MPTPRARRLLCLVAVAAALALAAADRASAQGTSGALPDPISSRDLDVLADRLDLSPEQRQAIEPFHDEYRESFRRLRESDIEEYLDNVGGLWRRGFGGIDRREIEESLQRHERIDTSIRLLDDGFFNNVQTVLTKEQLMQLPRAMQARERQRYSTRGVRMVGSVNQAARVDLSRLYDNLELTEVERQAIEPLAIQYETRLTAAARQLTDETNRVFLSVATALEEAGINFDDPASMMSRQDIRDVMREAWAKAVEAPRDKAVAVAVLNQQTIRQMAEFLPAEAADTLRERYMRRAYSEVPASTAARAFRIALRKDLPETVQESVEAARDRFDLQRDAMVDQMVRSIDAYRAAWTPDQMRRENRQAYEDELQSYEQRLAALDEAAIEGLDSLIGPDLAGNLDAAVAAADREEPDTGAGGRRGAGPDRSDEPIAGLSGPDPFLPRPITTREVATWARLLKLDDPDRFVLESLHEEYLTSFDRIRDGDMAALLSAKARMRGAIAPPQGDEDARPDLAAVTPEQVDELYELRARVLASVLDLDASLFDDVEALIAPPQSRPVAQRLRRARERAVYAGGLDVDGMQPIFGGWGDRGRRGRGRGRGGGGFGFDSDLMRGSQEATVDLGRVVDTLELPEADKAKVDELLIDYEIEAGLGFRREYEAVIELRHAAERMRVEMSRPRGDDDPEGRRAMWQSSRALADEQGEKVAQARKTMLDLNRATLAALTGKLEPADAAALDEAYKRVAFPGVFDDPALAEHYLLAALSLTDLSPTQASAIEAIMAETVPADREVANRMTEIYAAWADNGQRDRTWWTRFQEYNNKLEVLRFDRDEVNAKALRKLGAALTDAQKVQIRMPAEIAQESQGG